jgi:hypothetical protein
VEEPDTWERDLDNVPWSKLRHAYGPATDVPDQLRAIRSADKATRDAAFYELFGNIWHQHTIYEATPHAVPYLLSVLERDDYPDLASLLALLQCLATGGARTAEGPNETPIDNESASARANAPPWAKATRELTRRGIPRYIELLGHAEPLTRSYASSALGAFPEDAQQIVPELERRLQVERDPDVRPNLVLAIATLLRDDAGLARILKALLSVDEAPATALVTSTLLAPLDPSAIPPSAVNLLIEALLHPMSRIVPKEDPVWYVFIWPDSITRAIRSLGPDVEEHAMTALISNTVADPTISLLRLDALIDLAFPDRESSGRVRLGERLTAWQTRTLQILVDHGDLWPPADEGPQLLRYGLPTRRPELRRLIEERGT